MVSVNNGKVVIKSEIFSQLSALSCRFRGSFFRLRVRYFLCRFSCGNILSGCFFRFFRQPFFRCIIGSFSRFAFVIFLSFIFCCRISRIFFFILRCSRFFGIVKSIIYKNIIKWSVLNPFGSPFRQERIIIVLIELPEVFGDLISFISPLPFLYAIIYSFLKS